MNRLWILAIATIAFAACNKDDVKSSFVKTVIPTDINKLFESSGNVNSDTVWVFVQGGPTMDREKNLDDKDENKNTAYPFFTDDYIVYPFQAHHLNSKIATSKEFTFEDAKVESATTAEIVKNVVEHFTSQNKVVYLIGHSYGSFVVNEVLATYGSIARKTISLNGRLDMDEEVWKAFSRGEEYLFDKDGLNPALNPNADNSLEEKNMRKLAAGLGFNRYTKRFKDVDLSDAIFIAASDDKYVGDLTHDAVKLLKNKAEFFLELKDLGHSDIFNPELMEVIISVATADN